MKPFAQLTRETLHFPFAELAQVQKAFVYGVRLYRRDHRAKSLHDTMAYVAIVGVIGTEKGDVFALDEVSNLENRISHEHPEIFYLLAAGHAAPIVI